MRREHAEALAVKDQDLRRAEEPHTALGRRMLEDVDRVRQAAKQAKAGFAKEQQRRRRSEEAAAQTLEAGRQRLRETQHAAPQLELRAQLAGQAAELAKVPDARVVVGLEALLLLPTAAGVIHGGLAWAAL